MRLVPEDLKIAVERLWRAFVTGGLADALDLVDDDVEWAPATAEGLVLHGRDELLAWSEENRLRGRRLDAQIYALEQRGDAVVVAAHLRVSENGAESLHQVHWVYRFTDGRLRRADAFATREEALAALP